jgi:hypothetical protein
MNSKKIILLGCAAACVFAASTATAQMRGHGGSMGRMGMRGGVMPHSMGRMPMQRGPMMNSPSGFQRFGNRDFNRTDRFGRFNRFNDGRFVRDNRFHRFNRFNRFHHFNHFNNVVFIGDFGFPGWWGWGWGYPYGYYGYPYGYYGYGYGDYGGYGSGYGYGDSSGSRVAELQSRLARAGYYYGSIDGIMGPATRRAIRAYERDHGYAG